MRTRAERLSVIAIAMIAMVVGLVSTGTAASAAPYATQRTLSVSIQAPVAGATLTVAGEGFSANVDVRIELRSQVYTLGFARTSSTGEFSTRVTLPEGVTGNHIIAGVEVVSGLTATAAITILAGGTEAPPPNQTGVTVTQQQSINNTVKQSVISSTKQSVVSGSKQSVSGAQQSVSGAQELPRTGSFVVGLVIAAVALLIVGGLLILFAGRRDKTVIA